MSAVRPELLAPAGSPEALRSAVENGADAVYLGWGSFNARERAKGFDDAAFREALAYCHLRGVRVYLTLNTLLTDAELPLAWEKARDACRLGVDAVLVQDWGLLDLLGQTLPDLPLHASTQMSVMTAGGAELVRQNGCSRVVLARECSREDVETVRAGTGAEVEVFVHGALCVCCSGQCAMSALIGGRSGNRGRCAQPCRLPCRVDAIGGTDARTRDNAGTWEKALPEGGTDARTQGITPLKGGADAHGRNTNVRMKGTASRPREEERALNLKDNLLARHIPELAAAGIACLKIEGRLKRPEYVAVVTGIYARLLRENRGPTPEEEAALYLAFARSADDRDCYTDGYWTGQTGPAMFRDSSAFRGSAVSHDSAAFREPPLGDRTGKHSPRQKQALTRQEEFLTRQRQMFDEARAAYERGGLRRVPVFFRFAAAAGTPSALTATDGDGHSVTVEGPVPEPARNRPLTAEDLTARLSKTGGTVFRCDGADIAVEPGLSLSAAAVNGLRRDALDALSRVRTAPPSRRELPVPPPPVGTPPVGTARSGLPRLTLSVCHRQQVTGELLDLSPARVCVPLETLSSPASWEEASWEEALQGASPETAWGVILPRLWRDREEAALFRLLDRAREMGFTGILAGNIGHIALVERWSRERGAAFSLWGDCGLNVFNSRSLSWLGGLGLSSACVSFELRMAQIRDMAKAVPAEAVVYGHLPLMITENSLLPQHRKARGLDAASQPDRRTGDILADHPKRGTGSILIDQPERQTDSILTDQPEGWAGDILTDRTGTAFPLLPAWGGRMEIENSRPVWLADRREWMEAGLSFARLRFTVEPPGTCAAVLRTYRAALEGRDPDLLRMPPDQPFTRGLYDRGVE